MSNNKIDNCSITNRATLREDIDNPKFYTRVNPNDLVVGETYMYRTQNAANAPLTYPKCITILENTPDTVKFKAINGTMNQTYRKNETTFRFLYRFYKKNDIYGPRANYLNFTEGLGVLPDGTKAPTNVRMDADPSGYLTDDNLKKEISSYLGGNKRRSNKRKSSKRKSNKRRSNKRKSNKRKTKSNTRKRKTKSKKSKTRR